MTGRDEAVRADRPPRSDASSRSEATRPDASARSLILTGLLTGTTMGLALVLAFGVYLLVRSVGPHGGIAVEFDVGAMMGGAPLVTASAAAAGVVAGALWSVAARGRPAGRARTILLVGSAGLPAAVATWVPSWTLLGPWTARHPTLPDIGDVRAVLLAVVGGALGAGIAVGIDRIERTSDRSQRLPAVARWAIIVGASIGAIVGASDPLLDWLLVTPDLSSAQQLAWLDIGSALEDGPPFLIPDVPLGAMAGAIVGASVAAIVVVSGLAARVRCDARAAAGMVGTAGFFVVGVLGWLRAAAAETLGPVDPLLLFRTAAGEDTFVVSAGDDSLARHLAVAGVAGLVGAALALTTWQLGVRAVRIERRVVVAGLVVGAVLGALSTGWDTLGSMLAVVLGPSDGAFGMTLGTLGYPSLTGVGVSAAAGALLGLLAAATTAVLVGGSRGRHSRRVGWTAAWVALAVGGVLPLADVVLQRHVEVHPSPPFGLVVVNTVIAVGGEVVFIAGAMAVAALVARVTLREPAAAPDDSPTPAAQHPGA